jgi:imidazolonepropionase-like amidohydrolase
VDRGRIWDSDHSSLKATITDEIVEGADFIKVMNDDRIYSLDELKDIVWSSRELGKYVACHACTPATIDDAVAAGVRTVEHAAGCDEALMNRAAANSLYFCPTYTAAWDSVNCECDPDQRKILEANFTDCTSEEFRAWLNLLEERMPVTFSSTSSAKIVAGTDAGTYPTNFLSLHRELSAYTHHGASNLQALQTATINAAQAMDLDDVIGTIEVRKSADIVLLRTNPLSNLELALQNVIGVISRGHIVNAARPRCRNDSA